MESEYGKKNSVRADNQLDSCKYVSIINNSAKRKVLFVGNSITKHAPAPNIGWYGDWGMAATKKENDYVHLIMKKLDEDKSADFCIAQCSKWESSYINGSELLNQYYQTARDFNADIIIIRIGENIKLNSTIEDCKRCFLEMITYFNKDKNAKVIITNLFWKNEQINNMIQEIANENEFVFCDISDLEQDEKTMALNEYEHEGVSVHPSDFGMKCIADKILKCI